MKIKINNIYISEDHILDVRESNRYDETTLVLKYGVTMTSKPHEIFCIEEWGPIENKSFDCWVNEQFSSNKAVQIAEMMDREREYRLGTNQKDGIDLGVHSVDIRFKGLLRVYGNEIIDIYINDKKVIFLTNRGTIISMELHDIEAKINLSGFSEDEWIPFKEYADEYLNLNLDEIKTNAIDDTVYIGENMEQKLIEDMLEEIFGIESELGDIF